MKKIGEVFRCNDIAQMINEIRGVSTRQILNIKKEHAPALNWVTKCVYLDDFQQRSLSHFILSFLRRPFLQPPTLDLILAEYKRLRDFSATSKSTLRKWCRKLAFYNKSGTIKEFTCQCSFMWMLRLQPVTLLK